MVQVSEGRAPPAGSRYIPALDGLRAVSILLVVASHAGLERVLPGAFGVTLFFFISGYLITRQLLGGLAAGGRIGFGGFYARRALRLMPAGAAYVLVSGLAYEAAGGRISALGWAAALFYGANYYDLWAGYRSVLTGVRHPFNVLWSLAIEEHFYLAWPAVLAVAWRYRVVLWVVLGLCGAALGWRLWLFWELGPGVGPFAYKRLYVGSDTRFDSILWGAMLALVEARGFGGRGWWAEARPAGWVLLVLSFLLPFDVVRHAVRTTMQGAALVVLVPVWLRWRVLAGRPALVVGRLSYSLYLWHWGAFAFADWAWPGAAWRQAVLGVPLAFGLAVLSYRVIELPMLRWRRRAGSHAPDFSGGAGWSSHGIGRSATSLAAPSTALP